MSTKQVKMTGVVPGEVKKSEMVAHSLAGVGQNLIFGLWSNYMLVFYTDVFGITAAAAGIIMMAARIFDAFNDPISGMITDRTRTRWGRYRPWFLFMTLPVVILIVLCFSTPNISVGGKVVYAAITYVLMSTAFDFVDVPFWTLPAAMTVNVNKRSRIYGNARIFTTVASVVVGVIALPMVDSLGGGNQNKGFFLTALVLGIIAAVLYLIGFLFIKEHVAPRPGQDFKFKDIIKAITQNKPLLLIILSMILAFGATYIRNNLMIYYVQYNLNSRSLVPLFSMLLLPGVLLGGILTPFITKKFGQKATYISACIFCGVANLVLFFVGYQNVTLVIVLYLISSLPIGFFMVLISSMIANTIEYAEWKTGQRSEGLISSTQTLSAKVCIAIGSGGSGLILTLSKYQPNVVQATSTMDIIHLSMTLLVAIGMFVAVIPMWFNNFTDKRHAEIVAELEQRRQAEQ
ncbi:MAG: MFS transporter [Oscillospiraceae bacterium]